MAESNMLPSSQWPALSQTSPMSSASGSTALTRRRNSRQKASSTSLATSSRQPSMPNSRTQYSPTAQKYSLTSGFAVSSLGISRS